MCNHDIAKLPTYRGGRRTDNKLSKLFKIIYLARFHPSEHTGTNIREVSSDEKKNREVRFQHGATIAPWFLIGRMPLTLYSTIQNSLFGSCTLSHVTNSDTVMHSARFYRMADLGEKGGEHAGENGFLLEKLQKVAAKFGISVKHEL